jgi:hypothetical protein
VPSDLTDLHIGFGMKKIEISLSTSLDVVYMILTRGITEVKGTGIVESVPVVGSPICVFLTRIV